MFAPRRAHARASGSITLRSRKRRGCDGASGRRQSRPTKKSETCRSRCPDESVSPMEAAGRRQRARRSRQVGTVGMRCGVPFEHVRTWVGACCEPGVRKRVLGLAGDRGERRHVEVAAVWMTGRVPLEPIGCGAALCDPGGERQLVLGFAVCKRCGCEEQCRRQGDDLTGELPVSHVCLPFVEPSAPVVSVSSRVGSAAHLTRLQAVALRRALHGRATLARPGAGFERPAFS